MKVFIYLLNWIYIFENKNEAYVVVFFFSFLFSSLFSLLFFSHSYTQRERNVFFFSFSLFFCSKLINLILVKEINFSFITNVADTFNFNFFCSFIHFLSLIINIFYFFFKCRQNFKWKKRRRRIMMMFYVLLFRLINYFLFVCL